MPDAGVEDSGQKESPSYVVTVQILNSSSNTVVLNNAILRQGVWADPQPVPGSTIGPDDTQNVVTASTGNFAAVGAVMTFFPSDGGTLTMSWGKNPGQQLSYIGSASSKSLKVTYSAINVQSSSPTITFTILPAGAAA